MELEVIAIFVLLVSLQQTLCDNPVQFCTRERKCSPRVAGGTDVPSETLYPSFAKLADRVSAFCGATILTEEWLLTAAHCDPKENDHVTVGNPFLDPNSPKEQQRNILKFVKHENFSEKLYTDDIALLKLERPIEFSRFVQPARLVRKGFNLPDYTLATVVGWGHNGSGSTPKRLRQVDIPLVPKDACTKIIQNFTYSAKPNFHPGRFCFGFVKTGGKNACAGDSGGPLYATKAGVPPSRAPPKEHFVIGLVSFGRDCFNEPGVFTSVEYYLDWIVKNMPPGWNPYDGSSASRDFTGLRWFFVAATVILTLS